jgi:hypothetical protein
VSVFYLFRTTDVSTGFKRLDYVRNERGVLQYISIDRIGVIISEGITVNVVVIRSGSITVTTTGIKGVT